MILDCISLFFYNLWEDHFQSIRCFFSNTAGADNNLFDVFCRKQGLLLVSEITFGHSHVLAYCSDR